MTKRNQGAERHPCNPHRPGDQPMGILAPQGVVFSALAHEGLSVTVNGEPAQLAVLAPDGSVVATGALVAGEAMSVAINCYRGCLSAAGHLRVVGKPADDRA
jgi:hypothetical protein